MFSHAAAGYGGHGTLCGALGVCSSIINLVVYDKDETYRDMIDRMMYWDSESSFPTERFDDISSVPKQVKTKAMSPLCHTSVSKWTLAAGTQVTSEEKKERCAKTTGEVVYTVVHYLNEYFDGRWKPGEMVAVEGDCPLCSMPWAGRYVAYYGWHEPPAGSYGMPALSQRSYQRLGKEENLFPSRKILGFKQGSGVWMSRISKRRGMVQSLLHKRNREES